MSNRMKVIVKIQNVTNKNQTIPGATVNSNERNFQQSEEIIRKERSIALVGDNIVKPRTFYKKENYLYFLLLYRACSTA